MISLILLLVADMKGIDAAFTVRGERIDTISDSSGTVSGFDLNAGELFRRQLAIKLLQDLLSVSLSRPDDRVGIVVDNNSDVLVALPVIGLIDTDVDKVIKTPGTLRLDLVQCPVDTVANGLPVDPHVFGDGTSRQVDGEPPDSQVEVFREAASRLSPGNIRNEDSVLRV